MTTDASSHIGPPAEDPDRRNDERFVLSADSSPTRTSYDEAVRDVLHSFWAEPRVENPPNRSRWDRALVVAIAATVVFEVALRANMPWRMPSLVLGIGLAPTLLWRRTHPLAMIVIVFGTIGVLDVYSVAVGRRQLDLYSLAYCMVLAYALFRWGSGREAAIGLGVMLVPATVATVFAYTGPADAIGGYAVFFLVVASGAVFRYRARARWREREQVRLRERERLARDLHDTVAHHVSAIAIRAQAGLATVATNPDAAADALRVIEAEASRTLAEMRGIVRFLRTDEAADHSPNPLIADLRQLAGALASGPRVLVTITGEVDELSPSVSTAIYRMAQESVTNARRHARHATNIAVGVAADETAVHLEVTDDGETVRSAALEAGFGVTGMIERAHLLGGRCEAGPASGRGWTVTAVLPRFGGAGTDPR